MDGKADDRLDGDEGDVERRKGELVAAAGAIDPLAALRRHPLVTVGIAAALGAMVASPAGFHKLAKFLPGGGALGLVGSAMSGFAAARAAAARRAEKTPAQPK